MFEKTAAILEGFEFNYPTPAPVDLVSAVQLLKQEAATTQNFLKGMNWSDGAGRLLNLFFFL